MSISIRFGRHDYTVSFDRPFAFNLFRVGTHATVIQFGWVTFQHHDEKAFSAWLSSASRK